MQHPLIHDSQFDTVKELYYLQGGNQGVHSQYASAQKKPGRLSVFFSHVPLELLEPDMFTVNKDSARNVQTLTITSAKVARRMSSGAKSNIGSCAEAHEECRALPARNATIMRPYTSVSIR